MAPRERKKWNKIQWLSLYQSMKGYQYSERLMMFEETHVGIPTTSFSRPTRSL